MPIHEFDPERNACINPEDIIHRVPDMPKVVVTCFSHVTFARLLADVGGVEISHVKDAHSTCPVYKTTYHGQEIALFNTTVGAPSCVGALEDVFAMGAECAVVFGTCGVLEPEIADCSVIVPDAALRDEGTSYHYAPPAREIAVNERYRPHFGSFSIHWNARIRWGRFGRQMPFTGKRARKWNGGAEKAASASIWNAHPWPLWHIFAGKTCCNSFMLPTIWLLHSGTNGV